MHRKNIKPQLLWVVARDVEAVWIWRGEWDFPASPPWKSIPCEPGLRLKLSFWNLKSYNQVPRPHRRTSGMSLHPEVTHSWICKNCIFLWINILWCIAYCYIFAILPWYDTYPHCTYTKIFQLPPIASWPHLRPENIEDNIRLHKSDTLLWNDGNLQ